ncbi:propionyl-CoA synthetase [Pseudovibrio japonicus]|uniref:Propionyl-CoA synthetase n=1 Tax=Pseudovibrio japonicus TaxID=366534 RepID=A0ABQ3EKI3_9HYPH|nr:propionyl-CoA synthetase [Pseudovibrio japonicus]GHB38858.1 propionyl-CoA synthetase [Pseudovibrio japonicus]
MTSRYHDIYNGWKENKEAFWDEAAKGIDWFSPYTKTFDASLGAYGRWFVGGECNTCYNCVDRHVEHGRPGQPAIIYDSAVTGEKRTYTYHDVQEEVGAMAALLRERGVEKGTMVLIYMPMIPQAMFAMLACARLGAIHSVVFGGFAAQELAVRIEDCKPKAIVSASCGIEPGRVVAYKPLLDQAIELSSHKPDFCFIQQREQLTADLIEGRDFDLGALMTTAVSEKMTTECVPVAATDPLYVLYTSGTTGQPKGVVRDNGGHMVALKWSMDNLYGVDPGEVFWAASDVGWVVGHSYIVYAPLLHGAATILYEGKPVGTPDAGAFWRVISEHSVVSLFTAPTAFRAIKKEDPEGKELAKYSTSGLRSLFLAGERADPDTILWAENLLGVPVIDHWWQTETGWCIAGNPLGLGKLPVKLGSSTVPMPGYDMRVLDDEGNELGVGELGNIVVKLPMPPGSLPTLWNADDRFKEAYLAEFPGYYKTADAGLIDEDGYLFVMSRTDDIINVAGHRLSTGGMEEVLSEHPAVAECAVIGISDNLKGQLPCGFVVLKSGVEKPTDEIEKELIALVREKVGPVAAFKLAITVERLPKTRSGKILRGTMRKIVDGEDFKMPATIDDPAILDEIAEAISVRGLASVG